MDEVKSTTRAPRRLKWIVGGSMICLGIGGLAAWAMATPGAVSYYTTPSEIAVQGVKAQGRVLRVGGRVAEGTLVRDGASVRFAVTDGHNRIPVTYRGDVPDTLKERTDVIAEGLLSPDGTLRATRVLAKCSSKFSPARARVGRHA
jgi:cytochrome c-type biogenesis protein CcmE